MRRCPYSRQSASRGTARHRGATQAAQVRAHAHSVFVVHNAHRKLSQRACNTVGTPTHPAQMTEPNKPRTNSTRATTFTRTRVRAPPPASCSRPAPRRSRAPPQPAGWQVSRRCVPRAAAPRCDPCLRPRGPRRRQGAGATAARPTHGRTPASDARVEEGGHKWRVRTNTNTKYTCDTGP